MSGNVVSLFQDPARIESLAEEAEIVVAMAEELRLQVLAFEAGDEQARVGVIGMINSLDAALAGIHARVRQH